MTDKKLYCFYIKGKTPTQITINLCPLKEFIFQELALTTSEPPLHRLNAKSLKAKSRSLVRFCSLLKLSL